MTTVADLQKHETTQDKGNYKEERLVWNDRVINMNVFTHSLDWSLGHLEAGLVARINVTLSYNDQGVDDVVEDPDMVVQFLRPPPLAGFGDNNCVDQQSPHL